MKTFLIVTLSLLCCISYAQTHHLKIGKRDYGSFEFDRKNFPTRDGQLDKCGPQTFSLARRRWGKFNTSDWYRLDPGYWGSGRNPRTNENSLPGRYDCLSESGDYISWDETGGGTDYFKCPVLLGHNASSMLAGFGSCEGGQIKLFHSNELNLYDWIKISFWYMPRSINNNGGIEMRLSERKFRNSFNSSDCSQIDFNTGCVGYFSLPQNAKPGIWHYAEEWMSLSNEEINWFGIKGQNIGPNTKYPSYSDKYKRNFWDDNYIYIDDLSIESYSYCSRQECKPQMYPISYGPISNTFTPNGDGINDVWFVNTVNQHTWKIIVTNRWGVEVYTKTGFEPNGANNVKVDWNGTDNRGRMVPDGVYNIYFELKNCDYTVERFVDWVFKVGDGPPVEIDRKYPCDYSSWNCGCRDLLTISNKKISAQYIEKDYKNIIVSNSIFYNDLGEKALLSNNGISISDNTWIQPNANFCAKIESCVFNLEKKESIGEFSLDASKMEIENNPRLEYFIAQFDSVEPNLTIQLFPNPTSSILNCKISNFNNNLLQGRINVTIQDLTGKDIIQKVIDDPIVDGSFLIDLSAIPKGIYIIEIKNVNFIKHDKIFKL